MPYAITYPSQNELAVELTTETAGDAATLARQLVQRGHAPTIERDGERFTIEELERIAAEDDSGE